VEERAFSAEAGEQGIAAGEIVKLLGGRTYDIFLNDAAYWRNVPAAVWEYYICGYQVIMKWLSYREDEILGRTLKPEEAREVTNMARRLAVIVLVQPELDRNYREVAASTYAWKS
jgi:hypothetical protein